MIRNALREERDHLRRELEQASAEIDRLRKWLLLIADARTTNRHTLRQFAIKAQRSRMYPDAGEMAMAKYCRL